MIAWLRRSFIAGFFVTVPLIVSVAGLVWIFGIIDSFTAPMTSRLLGRAIPGLGLVLTVLFVLTVGGVTTNVIGRRVVSRAEGWLMRVPVFRTVYAPVKQLLEAFSPDNEYGFKRVVMVKDREGGWIMGFLTKEFTSGRDNGAEELVAVYIPTNHLYLGDIGIYAKQQVCYPDLSVEDGVRIFLTGGMSLPDDVRQVNDRNVSERRR